MIITIPYISIIIIILLILLVRGRTTVILFCVVSGLSQLSAAEVAGVFLTSEQTWCKEKDGSKGRQPLPPVEAGTRLPLTTLISEYRGRDA